MQLDCGNNSNTFWKIEATCLFLLIENLRNFHIDMQGKSLTASTFRRGLHLYPLFAYQVFSGPSIGKAWHSSPRFSCCITPSLGLRGGKNLSCPMTLQDIVDKYEGGLRSAKTKAQMPGFGQGAKPRRNFYYDIKYVRDLEMSGANDYDLLFACVFNRERHLWLMSETLAKTVTTTLLNGNILGGMYANFDELYDAVRNLLKTIKSIGDVAYYDVSLRIGALKRFRLYPTNKVYYHSYLRESARKLLGVSRVSSFRMDVSYFRSILTDMPAIFIEDFLCSMHDDICSPSFTFGKLPAKFNLTVNTYF